MPSCLQAPGYGHMQPQNPAMAGYGGYQQSYAPQAYSQGAYPYQQYHMQQAFPYQGNQGFPPQAASGYGNGPQAYQGGKQYSGYQGEPAWLACRRLLFMFVFLCVSVAPVHVCF